MKRRILKAFQADMMKMCLIIKVHEERKISGCFIHSAVFFKIAVQSAGHIVPVVLCTLLLKLIFKKH
jgi:hypothetical protein